MSDSKRAPDTRKRLLTLLYVALGIFLALSLATYSVDDPALKSYPIGQARNLMGPVGANVADFLVDMFGKAAWLFPVFLWILGLSQYQFLDTYLPSTIHLAFGWGLILIGTSITLSFFGSGNDSGLGGLFGHYARGFITEWFGTGGVILISATCLFSGLMIGTFLEFAQFFRLFNRRRRENGNRNPWATSSSSMPEGIEWDIAQEVLPKIADPRSMKRIREAPLVDDDEFRVKDEIVGSYSLPSLDLLNDPPKAEQEVDEAVSYQNAKILEQKLLDFGVAGKVVEICPGPIVTMYEFSPAPGVKINKVASLQDDIALALKSHSVRIVAPIPGKSVIGIELANPKRQVVYLKEILDTSLFKKQSWRLPLALGKDIVGEPVVTDLSRMPHLLIAGATGTGKSVGLNAMICTLLFRHIPSELRLLMIDPKRIELSLYDGIPHLLHPVVSMPKEATKALRWTVLEMERRYQLLEEAEARNIETYNQGREDPLPYLIVVIDELADLMMVSSKEVESAIARLAQMARAAGIHLIVATQRPSVDVLTGLIKANFPARISFKVSSKVDSRTILDTAGAERLLGMGDMLFLPPGSSSLERIHGAYCSEKEIKRVTAFWKAQGEPEYDLTVTEADSEDDLEGGDRDEYRDEFYGKAIEMVIQSGQASISMLQRRLRVGYNRAARMIEQMEKDGIVSPADSMGRRQVLH